MKRALLALGVVACSSTPRPTGGTVGNKAVPAVATGWLNGRPNAPACTNTAPTSGVVERPTIDLFGEPGGRAMMKITPTDGLFDEELFSFSVVYTAPGAGSWSIFPDASGRPAATALTRIDVVITSDSIGARCARVAFTDHAVHPPIKLTKPVWLVFESPDGKLGVGASHEVWVDDRAFWYQSPHVPTPERVPAQPFLHISTNARE